MFPLEHLRVVWLRHGTEYQILVHMHSGVALAAKVWVSEVHSQHLYTDSLRDSVHDCTWESRLQLV